MSVLRAAHETIPRGIRESKEVSGTRSEQCWAAQRHLLDVCPMRRTCEAVGLERDALRVEVAGLRSEVARLQRRLSEADDDQRAACVRIERIRAIVKGLSERVAGQAEILTQRAERTPADDLRDGDGDG